jgi:hypothetical protein
MSKPKQNNPNLPMIIMTGCGDGVLVEAGRWMYPLNTAQWCFEQKPYLPYLRRVMLGTPYPYRETLYISAEERNETKGHNHHRSP